MCVCVYKRANCVMRSRRRERKKKQHRRGEKRKDFLSRYHLSLRAARVAIGIYAALRALRRDLQQIINSNCAPRNVFEKPTAARKSVVLRLEFHYPCRRRAERRRAEC